MVCLCEHWESDGSLKIDESLNVCDEELGDDKLEFYENYKEYIKSNNINMYQNPDDSVEIEYSYDIVNERKDYDFEENGVKYIHIGYCKLAKARIEPWADFCCPIK